MKKMLLVLALAVCSYANAQKGSVLVMGSIEYNSQKTSYPLGDNTRDYFGFLPKVGYQFHENWTAGLEANIGTFKNQDENVTLQKTTNFSAGGFIRYSKPLNETFSFYTDLGLGFQSRKETVNSPSFPLDEEKGDGMYVNVTPAIFINVHKGFGLNFNIGGLGYNTLSYDNNGRDVKTLNFTLGRAFSIGVSKNF
ncbi:outer membrane beta-barrel protein [Flavobacterium notoginsengisoli]|uniref:outer membrane beta-barrel protein n=1 Tax=Flavobacterium notoginsengisoli TaxID=1478199 RepID=UPI003642B5F9